MGARSRRPGRTRSPRSSGAGRSRRRLRPGLRDRRSPPARSRCSRSRRRCRAGRRPRGAGRARRDGRSCAPSAGATRGRASRAAAVPWPALSRTFGHGIGRLGHSLEGCPALADGDSMRRRALRFGGTLLVTAACAAYLVWKIDLRELGHVLADARIGYFAAALGLLYATIWPLAWRWRLLLRARGIDDNLAWLSRAYLVSYAAGQVLPTSLGGDATRIFETSRRHPGRGGVIAGSVLLERALGSAATLVLAAVGFALALGHYDVGAYLWLELGFVVAAVAVFVLLFARSARPLLARVAPVLRRIRLERPVRAVYEGIHSYRGDRRVLTVAFAVTLALQTARVLTIWLVAEAVHVDLSPRPFFVMGPLLFLVMLVPFTINGFALRESFFVSFLGGLGVAAEPAFATGFLFFLLSTALALPGAAIVLWQSGRRVAPRRPEGSTG